MKYVIDYGYGEAVLYTNKKNYEERFYELSSQCFGIRKSVEKCDLISKSDEKPLKMLDGECERLEHDGDIIVWNSEGEKIKSEWDF